MDPITLFKSLADNTRLRILLLTHDQQELCVCELTAALGESQPKISRHLAQLRNAQLLSDRRQGQWVYYRINPTLPAWTATVLATSHSANTNMISNDLKRLKAMGSRPVRRAACC